MSDIIKVPNKDEMIELIKDMPDIYLAQFYKLSAYYLGFLSYNKNNGGIKNSDRGIFVGESEKTLMMLHILTSMASNGHKVESQVYSDPNKVSVTLKDALLYYYNSTKDNTEENVELDTIDLVDTINNIDNMSMEETKEALTKITEKLLSIKDKQILNIDNKEEDKSVKKPKSRKTTKSKKDA